VYNHKSGCVLRKLEREDLPSLLSLKNESWWGTHRSIISNLEDQVRWFDSMSDNSLVMIAMCHDEETKCWHNAGVALYTDIDYQNRSLRISGSIHKVLRKPLITSSAFAAGLDFAFEMLNVQRVEAEVLAYNWPAQRLEIDFLGFTEEGRRRRAVYKCGRYYDSILLGMLSEEWANHPRVMALGDTCNTNFSHDFASRLEARINQGKAAAVEGS
jgi:RimJ/RimL family protein N-acetyltransferase